MESTRQQKVAKLVLKELSIIFQRKAGEFQNKMISVTVIRMSPDLGLAKVYLSIFPQTNTEEVYESIKNSGSNIRFELGKRVKNQLRKVPELNFYLDDSLDYVDRIDELLK